MVHQRGSFRKGIERNGGCAKLFKRNAEQTSWSFAFAPTSSASAALHVSGYPKKIHRALLEHHLSIVYGENACMRDVAAADSNFAFPDLIVAAKYKDRLPQI